MFNHASGFLRKESPQESFVTFGHGKNIIGRRLCCENPDGKKFLCPLIFVIAESLGRGPAASNYSRGVPCRRHGWDQNYGEK